MENGNETWHPGRMLTVTYLTEEEKQKYREMKPGVQQDAEVIRWIADKDGERQIIEQRAEGFNRIRLKL